MTHNNRFGWMPACLCLLAGFSVCLPRAMAGDSAEFMPGDSIAYVGWSNLMDAKGQAQFVETLQALEATTDIGEPKRSALKHVFELLTTLVSVPGGCIGLLDLGMTEEAPDIQVALVLEAGGEAEEISRRLDAILSVQGNPQAVRKASLDGVAVHRAVIPETPVEAVWGVHKQRFFAAVGEAAARRIIQRLNGQGASLADAPELKFDRAKVNAQPGAAKLEVFIDLPAGIAKTKQLIEQMQGPLPPIVDTAIQGLGIASIKSVHACMRDANDMPVVTGFIHVVGPLDGVLSLWRQQPLSDEDLKVVSCDARWAAVWNLDLRAVWENTLQTVKKIHPESLPIVQGGIGMAAGVLGFTSLDQMWSVFGDTWAVYDAPDHGGLLVTGAVLVAEVNNRQALESVLSRVVATVNTFAKKKVTLIQKETQHDGHTVCYVLIGGVPCPVAPAWGFAGDRWVFGLFPQTVAEAMKQVDTKTRRSSILDHRGFQAARKLSPATVQSLGYMDMQYATRLLYPLGLLLQTAVVSQLAPGGLSLDLQTYPPLPETLEGVHNCVSTMSTDDDGILYVSAGSGQPVLVAVSAAALATSVALPSLSRAREQSKRLVSAANLKEIATACKIYANENDERFPASLQELVERGDVPPRQLQSPFDPPGTVSYVYVAGQTEASDPRNVLVYERLRGADGANVAFVDGHVKWMKPEPFKRALLATYQRLERAEEMPLELRP